MGYKYDIYGSGSLTLQVTSYSLPTGGGNQNRDIFHWYHSVLGLKFKLVLICTKPGDPSLIERPFPGNNSLSQSVAFIQSNNKQ